MSYQIAVVLQMLLSAISVLFSRKIALSTKGVFFGIGTLSYLAIGVMGYVYASIAHGSPIISMPEGVNWLLLAVVGFGVPISWLIHYKLLTFVGASNATIISTINVVATATIGIIVLGEPMTTTLMTGGALVIVGVVLSLGIKTDTTRRKQASVYTKIALIVSGSIIFSVAMFVEKSMIDQMGMWNYAAFGWGMQAVGAFLLCVIFGRRELKKMTLPVITKGLGLGFITSLAGLPFAYALSVGNLSNTILASSGRTAIVVVFAAVLFRERNNLGMRIAAFVAVVIGTWLLLR